MDYKAMATWAALLSGSRRKSMARWRQRLRWLMRWRGVAGLGSRWYELGTMTEPRVAHESRLSTGWWLAMGKGDPWDNVGQRDLAHDSLEFNGLRSRVSSRGSMVSVLARLEDDTMQLRFVGGAEVTTRGAEQRKKIEREREEVVGRLGKARDSTKEVTRRRNGGTMAATPGGGGEKGGRWIFVLMGFVAKLGKATESSSEGDGSLTRW